MWAVGSFDLVGPFSFVGHLCCVSWIDHLGDLCQSHSIPVLHWFSVNILDVNY